ncbi:MAG: hypothetical protein HGA36_02665 [Candidatus Moranbacteria bacterium]|nr:hypothetical protein [Candidatus Moranbacteria bacterium]
MRLKFLFFPIVLVIALAIFFGFIWPEFGNLAEIRTIKAAKMAELKAINDKQAAIAMIGKKISDNMAGEAIVNEYLPKVKVEEKIINGINYLATDANISLVNMTVGGAAKDVNAVANQIVAAVDPATGLPVIDKAEKIKYTTVSISLVGEYDKIRLFLDNLQKMPMLNTIQNLNIHKQENKPTEDAQPSSLLAMTANVDFGYLGVSKIDNQLGKKFEDKLDDQTIESLASYISQKSQLIEGGSKGKANPFLAN